MMWFEGPSCDTIAVIVCPCSSTTYRFPDSCVFVRYCGRSKARRRRRAVPGAAHVEACRSRRGKLGAWRGVCGAGGVGVLGLKLML